MPSSLVTDAFDGHIGLADQMIAEYDGIHVGSQKTVERFGRRADDWLVANVERRVQDDGNPSEALERLNEPVKPRIASLGHGLDTRRSVDVGDRRNGPALGPDLGDEQHERTRLIELEVLADALLEDGRREGPKSLAKLDFAVHLIAHGRTPRVGKDASVPERARAEFHAA